MVVLKYRDPTDGLYKNLNLAGPTGPAGANGAPGEMATFTANNCWVSAYPGYISSNVMTLPLNNLFATRVVMGTPLTSLAMEVTTVGSGASLRLGVYSDTTDHMKPNALLSQSSDISAGSLGWKTFSVTSVSPFTSLPPGPYWLAVQNVSGVNATIRANLNTNPYWPGFPALPTFTGMAFCVYQLTSQGAAMPSTWPTGTPQPNTAPVFQVLSSW